MNSRTVIVCATVLSALTALRAQSNDRLASCVAIIVVSKLFGKVWLMRREDYYDA